MMRAHVIEKFVREQADALGEEMKAYVSEWTRAYTGWERRPTEDTILDGINKMVVATYTGNAEDAIPELPETVGLTWNPEDWMVTGIEVPATFQVEIPWAELYEASMAQERRATDYALQTENFSSARPKRPGAKREDHGPTMGPGRDYEHD